MEMVAACGGGGNQQASSAATKAPDDQQIYISPIGGKSDVKTLDPALAYDIVSIDSVQMLFTGLVQFDDNLKVKDQLAASHQVAADGVTWTRLTNQPGTGLTMTACPTNPGLSANRGCPIFRGSIAVDAATGDMYALTVDTNNSDQGLWRDACGLSAGGCTNTVAFGTRLDSSVLEVGSGSTVISQGDYDLSLAAVASGSDTLLFVGTTDLYRCSIAAGCVLRNTTNAVSPQALARISR